MRRPGWGSTGWGPSSLGILRGDTDDLARSFTQYVEFQRSAVSAVLELPAERYPPGTGLPTTATTKTTTLHGSWPIAGIDLQQIVDEAQEDR